MQKNYIKKERIVTIAPFYFSLYFIKITVENIAITYLFYFLSTHINNTRHFQTVSNNWERTFSLWTLTLHNPLKHLLQLISRMMHQNRSSMRTCIWVCCCTKFFK
ncbi:hypothetical protein EXW39_19080 [Bacillus mycoides]|nr:hypothetical protein EXW39_19080 [Bacillus mycoides]